MKTIFRHKLSLLLFLFVAGFFISTLSSKPCFAGTNFTVSPMYQKYSFTAGETKTLEFRVYNPEESDSNLDYELEVDPFFKDDNNDVQFSAKEDYSLIVDWITLSAKSGSLKPGEGKNLKFTVKVPSNAPAGGQYAAILVKTKVDTVGVVAQNISMAHLLYADVAGITHRDGTLSNTELKTILFSGNISASITAKNLGNVHAYAKQRLEVSGLFGGEIYSSPISDSDKLIMPGASRRISAEWNETPSIGVFRVKYTVDFEGSNQTVERIVVICPLWLLTIIIIAVAIAIVLILRAVLKKHDKKEQV